MPCAFSCFLKKMQRENAPENENIAAEDLGFSRVIYQDKRLYRFTSDSVLLSRFARAKTGDNVADFCSGCGIVAFHFYLLNEAKKPRFTLFELQEDLMNLARLTAKKNGFENFSFVTGRLQDLPKEYFGKFSLVLCNPPYETGGFENESYEKAICRKEIEITWEEIVKAAKRALKFGGRIVFCHKASRAAEVIGALDRNNFAVKRMQFVSGGENAEPYLVLIEAVYGGKPGAKVLPELINTAKSGAKTGAAAK